MERHLSSHWRGWHTLLVLLCALALSSQHHAWGQAEKAVGMEGAAPAVAVNEVRDALIIANESYTMLSEGRRQPHGALLRPISDARQLKEALEGVGFRVTVVENLHSKTSFDDAIRAFAEQVREKNAVAFVYYTGHAAGLRQLDDEDTFLIPVQLEKVRSEGHLADQSYPLSAIAPTLRSAGTRLEIIVIDACRNNPIMAGLPVRKKGGVQKGIPRVAITQSEERREKSVVSAGRAQGTAIFYAATGGATTNDDGLYAQAWRQVLNTEGLSLGQVAASLNDLVLPHGGTWGDASLVFRGDFIFRTTPVKRPVKVEPIKPPPPVRSGPVAVRRSQFEKIGGRLIRIEGGSFQRGSEHESDEGPVKTVNIRSFEMSHSEVTVEQYAACVNDGACTTKGLNENSGCNWQKAGREKHPINCVSWEQAQTFAEWAEVRLPSEAQWEFAARGSKGRKYPWGPAEPRCDLAIFDQGDGGGCGTGKTWPVCSRTRGNTPEGLCDLAGNVWEWVEDCYQSTYEGAPVDGTARTSYSGSDRVLRGGGWSNDGDGLRAANRNNWSPGNRNGDVGFRVVRSAPLSGGP